MPNKPIDKITRFFTGVEFIHEMEAEIHLEYDELEHTPNYGNLVLEIENEPCPILNPPTES